MCRILYLNHPRCFASLKRSSGDVDIRAGPVNLALDFYPFHGDKPSVGERKLIVSILNHDIKVVLALRKMTAIKDAVEIILLSLALQHYQQKKLPLWRRRPSVRGDWQPCF
jgi:hypothetical protein